MVPKGTLLIIGGAEDKGDADFIPLKKNRLEILKKLLHTAKNNKIEIITTGTQIPEEVKKQYLTAFRKIDYPNPGFLYIKDKLQANNKKNIQRVNEANAVFFTGGDQFRLSSILGGTPIADTIKKNYMEQSHFLVAGTSAGAMVMSSIMINSGDNDKKILLGRESKTSGGFGLLPTCIVDTHFIKRGRFSRLTHAITMNPEMLGIGLEEDTALIINKGVNAECIGSGMVVIIDGKHIRQTNIAEAKKGEPVFVENLKVHLLVDGCRFSLRTRKLI